MDENEITNLTTPDDNIGVDKRFIPTDYRGVNQKTNTNTNKPIQNKNAETQKTTYASVTEMTFPKPQQAIIIEATENTPLREYQVAVGQIVSNQNIIFASRMSRNRICIYLKTQEMANDFVIQNPSIKINNTNVNVRKLRSNAKRITFSEVPPFINNIDFLDQLKSYNIEVLSPIILLKSNMRDPEFAHVYSFRRQALIKTADQTEIPDFLHIEVDGEIHRIYLTDDDIRCMECKNKGHTSKKCKRPKDKPLEKTLTQTEEKAEKERRKREASNSLNTPTSSEAEDIQKVTVAVSEQVIPGSQPSILLNTRPNRKKRKTIKTIENTQVPLENLLSPIKNTLERHQNKYPLTFDQLQKFILETKGVPKNRKAIVKVAKRHVTEVDQLGQMLYDLYPELQHRSIKGRFTTLWRLLTPKSTDKDIAMDAKAKNSANDTEIEEESEDIQSSDIEEETTEK